MGLNLKVFFQENSCICICQLLGQFLCVKMILVHAVSADVVRYRNDSTRCSPIRAPALYIYLKEVHTEEASDHRGYLVLDILVLLQAKFQIIHMIGRLTTQVSRQAIEMLIFQIDKLVLSYGYVGVKCIWFIPWLVEKGMIHEPTQRFNGLLGDTCNGCRCVDQNVV